MGNVMHEAAEAAELEIWQTLFKRIEAGEDPYSVFQETDIPDIMLMRFLKILSDQYTALKQEEAPHQYLKNIQNWWWAFQIEIRRRQIRLIPEPVSINPVQPQACIESFGPHHRCHYPFS
jgi:hypothetical protein